MAPFFSIMTVLKGKAMQFIMLLKWKRLYILQELWSDTVHLTSQILIQDQSYHQAKDFIRENEVAFRCCLQPDAFILHSFTKNFTGKLPRGFQKLWL